MVEVIVSMENWRLPETVTTLLLSVSFSEKIFVHFARWGVEGSVMVWEGLGKVSDPLKLNKGESPV